MSQLIEIASREIGIRELPGDLHNERIVQYANEAGFENISRDESHWCSYFMNWVAHKAGLKKSNSGMARSWLRVGRPVDKPLPGDIVIFWREAKNSTKGHVGIFMGFAQGSKKIYVLGGNQGDSVSIKPYLKSRLLGYRRLGPAGPMEVPNRDLYYGDYGPAVVKLQEALSHTGFFFELADGQFEDLTEQAVKDLQSTTALEINGYFDEPTRDYLMELLKQLA